MVDKKIFKGTAYFKCSICGFFYNDKKLAQQCEDFCKAHKSCSLEITRHAVKIS